MTAARQTESWETINWKKIQKNVFRLQKRIYQASKQGNQRKVKSLQRLLLRSYSAKLLATRKVTQDNRGKCTTGVDGKANLNPQERLDLAQTMTLTFKTVHFSPFAGNELRNQGNCRYSKKTSISICFLNLILVIDLARYFFAKSALQSKKMRENVYYESFICYDFFI